MANRIPSTLVLAGIVACTSYACVLSSEGIPGGTGGGFGGSAASSTGAGGSASSSTSSTGGTGGSTSSAGGSTSSVGGSTGGGPVDPGATCADAIENGLETDVDCGGDACAPCGPGAGCVTDADCVTHACQAGSCAADPVVPSCEQSDQPTCNDCATNGLETDVDCGGDACAPCGPAQACLTDADCVTNACEGGKCAVDPVVPDCMPSDQPTCHDCAKNGPETDVDCGGDACNPCAVGKMCGNDGDCVTSSCAAGVCAPAP